MDKWTYQTKKVKNSNSEKKVSEPINITNPFDVLKKIRYQKWMKKYLREKEFLNLIHL